MVDHGPRNPRTFEQDGKIHTQVYQSIDYAVNTKADAGQRKATPPTPTVEIYDSPSDRVRTVAGKAVVTKEVTGSLPTQHGVIPDMLALQVQAEAAESDWRTAREWLNI